VKDLSGDGGVVKSTTKEGDGFKKPKDRDEVLGARPRARGRAARGALPAPQLPRLAARACAQMRRGLGQGSKDRGGSKNACRCGRLLAEDSVFKSSVRCLLSADVPTGTLHTCEDQGACGSTVCRQGPSPPARVPWDENVTQQWCRRPCSAVRGAGKGQRRGGRVLAGGRRRVHAQRRTSAEGAPSRGGCQRRACVVSAALASAG